MPPTGPRTPSRRHRALGAVLAALVLSQAPAAAAAPACRAELVVESSGGELHPLHERNAHMPWPTASMVKMLTALVAADAVAAGEVSWDTPYTVSAAASRVGGSQVYLKQGETFPLEQLLRGTLIESANDCAFGVAELVAGSEQAFVERMRAKARQLGLEDYAIFSPNGLPSPDGAVHDDRMTAWDEARVGAALMRHPRFRTWVREEVAPFRDGTFQLFNFNYLLRRYPPADGIKTGYHRRARFNIAASAEQHGVRLIAVALGCERKGQLFARSQELLEDGFAAYRPVTVVRRGERLGSEVPVADGRRQAVPVLAARSVRVMSYRGRRPPVRVLVVGEGAAAPLARGARVGRVVVERGGRVVGEAPVVAATAVAPAPWWQRAWRRLAGALPSF